MWLQYTEKNDPSGFLSLYRQDINLVLSQAPSLKAKKKLVRILKDIIDKKIDDIDWELQDIEYELFREQYETWDSNLPNEWNNTYPEWYLSFRDNIIFRIHALINVDKIEHTPEWEYILDEHNKKSKERERLDEDLKMIDECK